MSETGTEEQKTCPICEQPFSLLRRKKECSECGIFVCKQDALQQKDGTSICTRCDTLRSEQEIRSEFSLQVQELDSRIEAAAAVNERLAREQMNKTSELNNSERELQRIEKECATKEKDLQDKLEKEKAKTEKLKKTIEDLKKNIDATRINEEKLCSECAELCGDIESLKKQNVELNQYNEELKKKLERIQRKIRNGLSEEQLNKHLCHKCKQNIAEAYQNRALYGIDLDESSGSVLANQRSLLNSVHQIQESFIKQGSQKPECRVF